jgi:hypothetical protein
MGIGLPGDSGLRVSAVLEGGGSILPVVGKGAKGVGTGTTGAEASGAVMIVPHVGQGPVTPARLAGTVSLVLQAGHRKVRGGVTIGKKRQG